MRDNQILSTIGGNIRQLRLSLGWSQERLSFECNVDRTFVGKIERGVVNVSILTLCDIAHALGVNVKELM